VVGVLQGLDTREVSRRARLIRRVSRQIRQAREIRYGRFGRQLFKGRYATWLVECAKGKVVIVCMDVATQKARAIPSAFAAILREQLAAG
jgi:hypothetical protein